MILMAFLYDRYPQALFTAEQAFRRRFASVKRCVCFVSIAVVVNVCQYVVFFVFENIRQTRNASPFESAAALCLELSYRPDW